MRISTRRCVTGAAVAAATALLLSACGSSDSSSDSASSSSGDTAVKCANWKVGVVDDDVRRSAFYAIDHDLVDTKAFPNLKISYLALPALIQATGTTQFDVLEGSLVGVAAAKTQGIDLKILALSVGFTAKEGEKQTLSIFVPEDSDIKTPADLKGKKLGVQSFGATGTLVERAILKETYGLDTNLQGGDVKFVQLDPATLVTAVKRGQVDAASGVSLSAYQMGAKGSGLRQLTADNVEWNKLVHHDVIGGAFLALAKQVKGNEACYVQFREMLDASVAYTKSHIDEIAPEISKKTGLPKDYVLFQWKSGASEYYGSNDKKWVDAAQALLDHAAEQKLIPASVNVRETIVK